MAVHWEGPLPTYVGRMVESVRKNLPLPLFHLTDETSEAIAGVDEVIRRKSIGMGHNKLAHLSELEGEVIALDADVIVRADVQEVFDLEFDVAIAAREHSTERYNSGVMFSRCPEFFRLCTEHLTTRVDREPGFGWDQKAVNRVACSHESKHKVIDLELAVYNWSPKKNSVTDNPRAKIVHFKGDRKRWMPACEF